MPGATRELSSKYAPHADLEKKWSGHTAQFGASPTEAANHLLNVDLSLRNAPPEQRAALAASILTEYGVDPTDLIFTEAAGRVVEGQSQHNAGRASAMAEVAAVQYQQSENQVRQGIHDFAEARDESGHLLRPDFAEHEQKMAALAKADVSAGKQPTVDDLYHRASGRERIAKAKAANGSISGSGGDNGGGGPRDDSIHSIVSYAMGE